MCKYFLLDEERIQRIRRGAVEDERMHNGSFLRVNGEPVIESALKGDVLLDKGPDGYRIRIVSRKGFGVSIGCPKEPGKVQATSAHAQPEGGPI